MALDLCALGASEIAAAIRARSLTPTKVVQAHLDRINALDPSLNAFALVRNRAALAEAKALSGNRSLKSFSLAGVPIAISDNLAVAGEPTRMGSSATPLTLAREDDELVSRLRAAGAIIIGKTRVPELSIWPFTTSIAYGATLNPWDRTRTPGGSGGGAVAVATGMAALALCSDGGGSLRVPAACCSLVGIKPDPNLLPLSSAAQWLGLTQFGPLGRSVADATLALDVLAGLRQHLPALPPIAPLRITVSATSPSLGGKASPEVLIALNRAAGLLAAAGHIIVREDPPYPPDVSLRFFRRWLPGIAQDAHDLPLNQLEPRTQSMVRLGRLLQSLHLSHTHDESLLRTLVQWFRGRDLLLTPTLTSTAVPVSQWQKGGWFNTALAVNAWMYTLPWNLTGFPAASIPSGLSSQGLPIGLQLVALPGNERLILSLARQMEILQPFPVLPTP